MNKTKIIIGISTLVIILILWPTIMTQFDRMLPEPTTQLPSIGKEFGLSDDIKKMVQENVDNGLHPSLFIGFIDEDKKENYYYYGYTKKGGDIIDENTLFDVGPITTIFTSLLLADMVERGEVNLNDSVDKFLPENVQIPSKNGTKITLLDLATHTSGLPKYIDNLTLEHHFGQSDYTEKDFYEYLSNIQLSNDANSEYTYSYANFSLLGHVLSLHAGKSYEDLVKERIFDKLGMKNTCIKQCDELRKRFATPHIHSNVGTFQTDEIDHPEFMIGSGEIRSSGKDMLLFLSYAMDLKDSDLRNSFKLTQEVNQYIIDPTVSVGLGWHMLHNHDRMIIYFGGSAAGYDSFIGFDPESNQGVIILSNSDVIVRNMGISLLDHGQDSNFDWMYD